MIELPHLNDAVWQVKREKLWQKSLEYTISPEIYGKQEIEHYKEFFFTGDFKTLIAKEVKPEFSDVFELFPAETLGQLKYVIKEYWSYAHQKNYFLKNKDVILLSALNRTFSVIQYHPPNLMAELFLDVFGSVFETPLTIDVGLDSWSPLIEINHAKMSGFLTSGVKGYLFENNGLSSYPHYKHLFSYFFSVFPLFEKEIYNLDYAEEGERNSFGGQLQNSQFVLRKFLLLLMGHEIDDSVHNDSDNEVLVKKLLFQELTMPDEFYQLVEHLKQEGLDALELPEEEDEW